MLPESYRFTVKNTTGQSFGANLIKIYPQRYKFDTAGALTYEAAGSEITLNTGSLANNGFASSALQSNTTNKYLGGHFLCEATGIPASCNGNLEFFFDINPSGSKYDYNGLGGFVSVLSFNGVVGSGNLRGFEL